ncbi:hypothetical protein SAMN04488514_105200 [Kriegella aquimaris]|uniref:Uncharacterized protein n=1 Tax=Kriegella aquimaris TaxID=192904 RepID=A0A1G9QTL5_9FLAO|nr:hypothetical protein SAMN04488514_105200 [Kriegella aquimaris]
MVVVNATLRFCKLPKYKIKYAISKKRCTDGYNLSTIGTNLD